MQAAGREQAGLALIELDVAVQDLDRAASTVALLRQVAPLDPRVLYTAYRIATDQASEAMLSLSVAAPESAQMHQAMAHELERARDLPATIANLRKAAELDPALPGINYELAEVLRSSDDPKLRAEAEAQYKLALDRNPRRRALRPRSWVTLPPRAVSSRQPQHNIVKRSRSIPSCPKRPLASPTLTRRTAISRRPLPCSRR